MRLFLFFFLACMGAVTLLSQTPATGIQVGESCPSVINTSDNSIQSFVFPINHCLGSVACTEKEPALNRRTEFRFQSK